MFQFLVFMSMCIIYIIQGIFTFKQINVLYIIISILAFQQAFSKLGRKNQLFTGTLFTIGVLIHIIYGNQGLHLFEGITQNLPLLAIILLAPLISLPLKGEGIITTVIYNLKGYNNNKRKLFGGVSTFMMMLAPILNMGAIRIIHGFVEELKIDKKLLSNAYYGGFTPAIIWSPFFASVGIVISMAEMSYISYMPIGVFFAAIQFIIAVIMLRPRDGIFSNISEENKSSKKDYILLILSVAFLISLLISLETITNLPILLLVSINCIVIPIFWALLKNKKRWFASQIKEFKNQMVTKTNMEVALFLSAGLFGSALMHTPIATVLKEAITWSAKGTIILVFVFVISFITLMAFMGIHQIISTPIVFPLLLTTEIDITIHTAAFMCIYSWMFSSSLSPLNALNIIISNCLYSNGLKVAFNWNGRFFGVSLIAACIYVVVLNLF